MYQKYKKERGGNSGIEVERNDRQDGRLQDKKSIRYAKRKKEKGIVWWKRCQEGEIIIIDIETKIFKHFPQKLI